MWQPGGDSPVIRVRERPNSFFRLDSGEEALGIRFADVAAPSLARMPERRDT